MERFWRKIKKSQFFTLIMDYLRIKNFFQKSGSVTFLYLWYLIFKQNFRTIPRAVFEENYDGRMDGHTKRTNMEDY